jgi:uncharacterized MAPEG superfamily protein
MQALASNPSFVIYGLSMVVLSLNILFLWVYSGLVRFRTKTAMNPEDARTGAIEVVGADPPAVARVLRAHRNAVDNIVPFAILAFVFVIMGATPTMTAALCGAFTFFRLAHSFSYLGEKQPWRSLSFALGGLSTLVIAGLAVKSLIGALGLASSPRRPRLTAHSSLLTVVSEAAARGVGGRRRPLRARRGWSRAGAAPGRLQPRRAVARGHALPPRGSLVPARRTRARGWTSRPCARAGRCPRRPGRSRGTFRDGRITAQRNFDCFDPFLKHPRRSDRGDGSGAESSAPDARTARGCSKFSAAFRHRALFSAALPQPIGAGNGVFRRIAETKEFAKCWGRGYHSASSPHARQGESRPEHGK